MTSANAKARALLGKLERLADPANGGTPDEIATANRKLQRLKSRVDFSQVDVAADMQDIFFRFKVKRLTHRAVHVYSFPPEDFDIANSVKWAIEQATGVPCIFRGADLHASTTVGNANKLTKIARHISQSFQTLLVQFGRVQGVSASDRKLFVRGLYDGMMNDGRAVGERLPASAAPSLFRTKPKKGAITSPPRLAIHPYMVALGLGKQIRFSVPLAEITAELARATQPALGPGKHP